MALMRGIPQWTIQSSPDNVTFTSINNVTSVILTAGRRLITDLFTAGTGTITGRKPELLPTLRIGDFIHCGLNWETVIGGTGVVFFQYRVSDFIIDYGTVAAEDTWTIEVEDAFAYLGRASLPTTTIASGTNTATAAATIASLAGLTQTSYGSTITTTSAQTVTGQNALDVYQTLVNTEQAFVTTNGLGIFWYARNFWINDSNLTAFSDDNTVNTNKFSGFVSQTLADNYSDKVIVRPRGSSDVVVGTGIFNYNLDSFSFDTTEATFLGQFILGSLDVDFRTPRVLNVLINNQDESVIDPLASVPTQAVTVKFRGNTTISQVIGFRVFGQVDSTRYELYLADREFYRFLTLDDATLGKLNENKLGW